MTEILNLFSFSKEIFNYIAIIMCGRKTLTKAKKAIIKELFIDEWQDDNYKPSFNIAPTQNSPVLISLRNSRIIKSMKWGLVPSWSKNLSLIHI